MSDVRFSSLTAEGTLHEKAQAWPGALQCYDEAVSVARTEYGEHDKRLAKALEARCRVHKHLDNRLLAEKDLHESVTIRLRHMRRRGRSLSEEHKYREAEQLYRDASEVCNRVFGLEHRETATCLDNLATNLRSQSCFEESFIHASQALDIRLRLLGDEHAHTAASHSNVGHLCRILGRYDDAQTHLVRSLVIRERVYGPDHHTVAESLDRLASTYRELGRFSEATPLCERALRIREEHLGADHPLTAASKNNFALIHERRSDDASSTIVQKSMGKVDTTVAEKAPAKEDTAVANALPRENHAVGYAILVALTLGATAAGFLFWFLPWLGVVTGLAVLAFTLVSFLTSVSFESLVLRVIGHAKASKAKKQPVDRDVVLPRRVNGSGFEVKPVSRSSTLTAEAARELPDKAASETLDLHWVKLITPAAADELAMRRCGLCINALQDLPSKVAKAIRVHRGTLELNGITTLTVPAAVAIARHEGPSLSLDGLTEMTHAVAEHLAHHRGSLSLGGLRAMDEDAARWIIKHRGPVHLTKLTLATKPTVRILRSSPHVRLPDDLGEGI